MFGKGALARKMRRRYPDLESVDPVKRAASAVDYLADFVVDFGPRFRSTAAPKADDSARESDYVPAATAIRPTLQFRDDSFGPTSLLLSDEK